MVFEATNFLLAKNENTEGFWNCEIFWKLLEELLELNFLDTNVLLLESLEKGS